ncbi:MAG: hypothetical protein RR973_01890 [Anaerovoracaceae bacterium]
MKKFAFIKKYKYYLSFLLIILIFIIYTSYGISEIKTEISEIKKQTIEISNELQIIKAEKNIDKKETDLKILCNNFFQNCYSSTAKINRFLWKFPFTLLDEKYELLDFESYLRYINIYANFKDTANNFDYLEIYNSLFLICEEFNTNCNNNIINKISKEIQTSK